MKIKKNIAVSDSGFIFNPATGESFSVNPIGIKVFQLLKDQKTKEQITKVFMEEYDVSEGNLDNDLHDFIGLVEYYQLAEVADVKE